MNEIIKQLEDKNVSGFLFWKDTFKEGEFSKDFYNLKLIINDTENEYPKTIEGKQFNSLKELKVFLTENLERIVL